MRNVARYYLSLILERGFEAVALPVSFFEEGVELTYRGKTLMLVEADRETYDLVNLREARRNANE